ncbi:TPA: hypothetical protein ACURDR_001061 [Escherichia coli]
MAQVTAPPFYTNVGLLPFLTRYHQMLEEQYPLQENGQILLAFPRLFIVARRTE